MKTQEIEPATFRLVARYLNQLRYQNKDILMRINVIQIRNKKKMEKIKKGIFQVN